MAADTSKTLKQSFFKEYFSYKLRSLKGFNITFLAMNFMVTVVFALVVMISCIELKNDELGIGGRYYLYSHRSYWMMGILFLIFIAENALIMIMAAVNMKLCHNRSAMDTIGGLPLTVDQRFFGDFLSGFSSFAPTFFIGCIPALIMMAVIQFGVSPEYQAANIAQGSSRIYLAEPFEDKFVLIGFLTIVTMFLCLAASYTIACFVTSCSGKLNTSIIFSFGLALALPLISIFYNGFIVNNSIGVQIDSLYDFAGMLPPVGTIFQLYGSFANYLLFDYTYPTASPNVIIMLAVTILPAVGAYFISKKRKAERVDKPFIFKPLYTAASFVLTVTAAGMVLYGLELPWLFLTISVFTLAACIFIEYAGSHSKRTLWKGLVRFGVSAAVCTLFGVIVYNTYGFNFGKKLPDEKKIQSVSVGGSYFQNYGLFYETYDEPAIISAVLSEHKKIIDEIDEFPRYNENKFNTRFQERVYIQYHMKNGSEILRDYDSWNEKSMALLENFSNTILGMPEVFNRTTLGILNMPCSSISYDEDSYDHDSPVYAIKPSLQDEFIECLKSDLLNRPNGYTAPESKHPSYIYYSYIDSSGKIEVLSIRLYRIDKNTLDFLSNSDNYTTEVSITVEGNAHYQVYYYADGMKIGVNDATITFDFDPDTPAKRELVSYFETEYTAADDLSDKFRIEADGKRLKVKPENEQAALTILIKLVKEQVSGGNIS